MTGSYCPECGAKVKLVPDSEAWLFKCVDCGYRTRKPLHLGELGRVIARYVLRDRDLEIETFDDFFTVSSGDHTHFFDIEKIKEDAFEKNGF